VENHKDCKEVTVLGNITKNVKTSTMFNETEHLMFLYFILNYSFLLFNGARVGLSILSNFNNIFKHFFNQMLSLIEHS
jgi:hypothetical protein